MRFLCGEVTSRLKQAANILGSKLGEEELTPGTEVVWMERPWVVPPLVGTGIATITIAIVVTWFELAFRVAFYSVFPSVSALLITLVVVFITWLCSSLQLALLRASNLYALTPAGLEVQNGIAQRERLTVSASGFSDLKVVRSPFGRVLDVGDILVRLKSGRELLLHSIREPMKVAARVRQITAAPVVVSGKDHLR